MDFDLEALKTSRKKASTSLKRILFNDLNEDLPDFDETVDDFVTKILEGGPSVMESEQASFRNYPQTFMRISNEKSFQDYQNLNNLSLSQSFRRNEPEVQVLFESSNIVIEENFASIQLPRVESINGRSARQEVPAARQLIDEQVVRANNDLLIETFHQLKSQAAEQDENFTMTLDLSSRENFEKESLILPILEEHRESDFVTLFRALRPLLFDLLKIREGFKDFTQTLRDLAQREYIAARNLVNQLEEKDILLLLVQSCSEASLPKLGLWLSYQFYPLPLISLLGGKDYQLNLDCCLEYLFWVRKPLITSIGTKSAIGMGKSSFLSYLFSLKDSTYFSTEEGFTHFGSVDLYVNLPSDQQNYIVADVQSYRDDEEFMNLLSGVLSASQIILVHITKEDIRKEDGKVNLNFEIRNKSKLVYLWRDYDNDKDLLYRIEKSLEGSENELGIIEIPKLDGKQNFNIQNYKLRAMKMIFEKINSVNLQNCTPIVDLFKTFVKKDLDFDKEIEEIKGLLDEELKKNDNQSFTKSLLPCLFQDYKIIEELKKKTTLLKQFSEEQSESQTYENEKNYNLIEKTIQECMEKKTKINASNLVQKVMKIIASNQLYHILLLSEVINSWKMPHFENLRKQFIDINAQKDGGNLSPDEKKALVIQMDDKDLGLSTFIDEVLSYYESNKNAKQTSEYKGIKTYLKSCLLQGAPLNLVNSKTLKFGNALFKEIFDDIANMKNIFVISIIGAQSSAKSTLLNVLFGCGFSTSAGRCTKGLYTSLLHHPSGFKIMVIDTEGLLSVVGRDHEFDNLIATMTFSCSHVVIINNKGEINTKLRDLLEICVYAMKHLNLTTIKPKIIFALRDIVDNSDQIQQEMLLTMKSSLEQAANKLSININHLLDFSQEDIFLLPPAFQLSQGDNKTSVQVNNSLFSSRVLEMRQFIFGYLDSIKDKSIQNLRFFYMQTEQRWSDISERGLDIMRAKNFLEIEVKDEALNNISAIWKENNGRLIKQGQSILERHQKKLTRRDSVSKEEFTQQFSLEFKSIRDNAMNDLEERIFKNEKYAVISNSFNEFKEIIDYNLGWQKLRFVRNWNTSIISYELENEVKKLKVDIKEKIDEKIKNISLAHVDTEEMKREISIYFEGLIKKLRTDFAEQVKTLEKNITQNLPGEIYTHFDRARLIANRDKAKNRVIIPDIVLFIERLKDNIYKQYDPKDFYQYRMMKSTGEEFDKAIIIEEFNSFVDNLYLLLSDVASDDIALKIINDCLSRISRLETERVSVNRVAFIQKGLIEAMHLQYLKTRQTETQRLQDNQMNFEIVVQGERKHVEEILEHSSDSLTQGLRCARRWFKELKHSFWTEQEREIQKIVFQEIIKEFPDPESANEKASEYSFKIRNFKNVVKYVLNTNKFIREIYEQKIKILTKTEIEKNLQLQFSRFESLIRCTAQTVTDWEKAEWEKAVDEKVLQEKALQEKGEWEKAQEVKMRSFELSTLITYIDKNHDLKRYFPDLYAISLGDIKNFAQGCRDELSQEIKKSSVEVELKAFLSKNITEALKTQYECIAGCQVRCPMCNNKCIKADPVHQDHHTDCHFLAAFSGSYNRNTKELLLRGCFAPKNYESRWFRGEKEFKTYDEMINKEFPGWRQEFPMNEQKERLKSDIAPEVIECWVGVKDVLTRHYNKKENTPKEWLKLVEPSQRLPADLFIPGYMEKEKLKITE